MTYIWIGVLIASIVAELATPSALVSIWFALGALPAALLAYAQVGTTLQIVVFVLVSVLSLLLIRPMLTKYLRGNVVATNADRFINEIGVVTKAIGEATWGEVFIKSTYWSAVEVNGKSIEKDKKVKVIAIEGVKLLVKEIES